MQFADIKNDLAFGKIFGNEAKKEILISFLNAVLKLEGNNQIDWVEMLNPYQLPRIAGSKATVLDVRARDRSGNFYIVEMQVTDRKGLDKRVTYYSARGYAEQLDASEDFYKLKPVIFIGILDFEYMQNPNYLSRHLILDAETKEHKLKDLEFTFIELPKFTKTEPELLTLVDKWIFFIKNAKTLTIIPKSIDDDGLISAYQEANKQSWTKEELHDYDYARLRESDEEASKLLVIEKKINEIAKNFIRLGLDDELIIQGTGLTSEEVHNLKKELDR